MSQKTMTVIKWIATGVEAIGIGITIAIGGPYEIPICAAIPIARQAIVSICELFVRK